MAMGGVVHVLGEKGFVLFTCGMHVSDNYSYSYSCKLSHILMHAWDCIYMSP